MTEKELRKLKRSDFLQLLLAQSKENAAIQARLDETLEELARLRANNEQLNAQNELIDELKGNLNSKNATIDALRQEIEDLKANRKTKPKSKIHAPKAKRTQPKKSAKKTAKTPHTCKCTPAKRDPAPKTKRVKIQPPAPITKLLNNLRKRDKR